MQEQRIGRSRARCAASAALIALPGCGGESKGTRLEEPFGINAFDNAVQAAVAG